MTTETRNEDGEAYGDDDDCLIIVGGSNFLDNDDNGNGED